MIRQFSASDARSCCNLIRGCIDLDLRVSPAMKESLLRAESPRSMQERAALFYLAVYETEGEIRGVGGVDMNEIRLLSVAAGHRKRGVGSALLEHLEAMVPPALFADVFVYSDPAAAGFYAARGYAGRGAHYFQIEAGPLETIFMVKALRPG